MSKSVVRPHCSKSHRSFFITTQTLTSGAKSYTLIRKSEKDWDAQHCSESKMSFSLLTCMFSNSITQKHNMQCTTYQEEEKKKKKSWSVPLLTARKSEIYIRKYFSVLFLCPVYMIISSLTKLLPHKVNQRHSICKHCLLLHQHFSSIYLPLSQIKTLQNGF